MGQIIILRFEIVWLIPLRCSRLSPVLGAPIVRAAWLFGAAFYGKSFV
jgi:hypothetical protein